MRHASSHWLGATLCTLVVLMTSPALSRETHPEPGLPFQAVLDMEHTARLLAVLLDSGRAVITENQAWVTADRSIPPTPMTAAAFELQLIELFRSRSGVDLRDIAATRIPRDAKRWLPLMVAVSKQVVSEFQPLDRREGVKLIPAVFGSLVARRFSQATGIRLKQTSLLPRNPANAPDSFEKATLEAFADPSHPREHAISEVTTTSRALRLMYPLYTTRQCLVCHGSPKGELDKTGYPREGFALGQNAGAISVVIPLSK